ncbi:IS3 family transposase [Tetragenococcus halophilus]|uniref:IS3 family transposase n=1 Tax=Tetragenococcus halophilus TaxID=51669 RepID=UPI00295EF0CF|nr:IS3 family transposase [Tetragenococcus halophilus]
MPEYEAIKELHEEKGYPIQPMCQYLQVARSAYYRWLYSPMSPHEKENRALAQRIRAIHDKHEEMGYRRLRDELARTYEVDVNDKRVLRLCQILDIQSTIKHPANSITRGGRRPYHTAKNVLNREFQAEKPNEKWVTDISEFKYHSGSETRKLYLSAILDLYDRCIVAYQISDTNDNPLVMNTFDQAIQVESEDRPLLHSDRGFQYTSKEFYTRIQQAGMTQSMSRVAHCIDNGPMEGFWGMIKREKYYGKRFNSRQALVEMITNYITYYNYGRYQRKLSVRTPMEVHQQYLKAS